MGDEFGSLAEHSEAELWELIGQAAIAGPEGASYEIGTAGLNVRLPRRERDRLAGEAWFTKHRKALHQAICGSERLRRAFSSDPGAYVELARAIADTIVALKFAVPAGTVGMLVARKGLEWICSEEE